MRAAGGGLRSVGCDVCEVQAEVCGLLRADLRGCEGARVRGCGQRAAAGCDMRAATCGLRGYTVRVVGCGLWAAGWVAGSAPSTSVGPGGGQSTDLWLRNTGPKASLHELTQTPKHAPLTWSLESRPECRRSARALVDRLHGVAWHGRAQPTLKHDLNPESGEQENTRETVRVVCRQPKFRPQTRSKPKLTSCLS